MTRILFRNLPGIASIETRLRTCDRLFKDELEELRRDITDKSLELFGITERDTLAWLRPAGQATSDDAWEAHFEFLEWEFEEERAFWDAFGLDITDQDGEPLACIAVFGRQLVCALKRIHPDASVGFMGGAMSEDQLTSAAEAWGRRLLGK